MIQRLEETGETTDVQRTTFSVDVLGRYACNTWDEAVNNGGAPFDVIVLGAGMYGAYAATKLYRKGADAGLRILVLEAGQFLVSEHVQNLARIGINVPGPVASDPGKARELVWGLPWQSNVGSPGLAYCVGGRSIYWGGWAPTMEPEDLAQWPAEVAEYLEKEGYPKAKKDLGSNETADYIHGALYKELKGKLDAAQKAGVHPTVTRVEPAPLAVQGKPPASGLFSFDKFSSAPMLVDAIREDVRHSGYQDKDRRLFLVPNAHALHMHTHDGFVSGIEVAVNGQRRYLGVAPTTAVVLALGTVESTRLALASFPTGLMGRNLMGHLRSNLTVRIKRSAFDDLDKKRLEAAAALVRGQVPEGRYHLQVTAAAVDGKNSEETMWRMIPDIDLLDRTLASQSSDWIVVTFRGIGEMTGEKEGTPSDGSWMNLSPWAKDEHGEARAWVQIKSTPREEKVWKAIYESSLALAKRLARDDPANVEYLVNGEWKPTPPADAPGIVRDGLGTTHHEAGTLWMGEDPATSVTDLRGRFHHVKNAYAVGPSTFPTMGSANPAVTAIALARRTANAIVAEAAPIAEPGFTPLFDGTLNGWDHVGAGGFDVQGHTLTTRGGTGLLWYKRQSFRDFVLRLDYRQFHEMDNSGVFLRFPSLTGYDRREAWLVAVERGYEVQVDERGDGPLHQTGAVYDLAPATRRAAKPIGEWNALEVEAKGDRITVRLNGEKVSVLTDAPRGAEGHIGLQNHHEGSRVQFRNIRVKTL